MDVELADVPVHSLVPEPLRDVASVDDFMARLPEFDGDIAEQLAAAEAAGECLRFVGAWAHCCKLWSLAPSRFHVSCEAPSAAMSHQADSPQSLLPRKLQTSYLSPRHPAPIMRRCPFRNDLPVDQGPGLGLAQARQTQT